jgi:CP family cyanate transporter-like MFS transporter
MTAVVERRPLWGGRVMALLGIVIVALSLRTAVAGISPIVSQISVDIPLDSQAVGLLGAVPPLIFALAAVFTASIARRVGLERLLVIALVVTVFGHLLRSAANGLPELLIGTALAIAGAGIGNVLLPPLVKRYFPDRVGLLTSLYATVISIGSAIPAVLATPVADTAGWRTSLAMWSVLSAISAIPWIAVLLEHRRERAALRAGDEAPELPEAGDRLAAPIWKSGVAWTIALVFAVSTLNVYAIFAWLPRLLVQTAGVSAGEAGALLALNSIVGVPAALIIPILAVRMKRVGILLELGVAFFVLGYLGLLLAPSTLTIVWVIFIGGGPLIFPVCLALINLRTRTQNGSVALSGFAQAVGYTVGVLGPLVVGFLHQATGGWTAPLLFLIATALLCAAAGVRLSRPTFVEDELAAR